MNNEGPWVFRKSLKLERIPQTSEIPHRVLFPVNNFDFSVCRLELFPIKGWLIVLSDTTFQNVVAKAKFQSSAL